MIERRRIANPFDTDVVADPERPAPSDVSTIHRAAFERCCAVYEKVCAEGQSWSALLFGEGGCGKTHLLSRFRKWLNGAIEPRPRIAPGLFIAVRMESGPGHVWRHVRRRIAEEATRRLPSGTTSLDAALEKFAESVAGNLELAFESSPIRDLDRNVRRVLLHFAAGRNRRLCSDWLAGDALTEAEHESLNIASLAVDSVEEDLAEFDSRRVVLSLARLYAPTPIVFCFDQIEALTLSHEKNALGAFSRMGASLIDETTNSVVIATVLNNFLGALEDASRTDFVRIAKERLLLYPLDWEAGRELVEARLRLVPELQGENPISEGDLRAFFKSKHGQVNPRALIHEARKLFAKWQGADRPAISTGQFLSDSFERLWEDSPARTSTAETDAVLNHGLPVLLQILGHPAQERPVRNIDLGLKRGDSKVLFAYGNQADMRSYSAWLARATKQARNAGAQLCVLRDARLPIGAGAVATRKRLKELVDNGGRDIRVDAEALAALDAMRKLLSQASGENLSVNGETIPVQTVRDWLKANLPPDLARLAENIAGEPAATAEEQQPGFDALLDLLKSRKVVPLNEAAQECRLTQEQIEKYARSHPQHIHLFGGPRAVLCHVVVASPARDETHA